MVMLNRGSLVILFIFGLSAAMGGFAVWSHYQQGRRCLSFFGSETANMIQHAPQVTLFRLATDAAKSPRDETALPDLLLVGKETFAVEKKMDISAARGLIHARHALIVDNSYLWDDGPLSSAASWTHAIRFSQAEQEVVLLLDFSGQFLRHSQSPKTLVMRPGMVQAEQTFLEKQLALAESASAK